MDVVWAFREIYDEARQIKESQDAYCARALQDDWEGLGAFPEELQYEALVDVLRGRVKVQVHCYEAVDLDYLVRVSWAWTLSLTWLTIRAHVLAHERVQVSNSRFPPCSGDVSGT